MTKCKHYGHEIKMTNKKLKLTKVNGLLLTKIQLAKDYTEGEMICPKGFEMITLLEGIAIMESKDKNFFLNYEKGTWRVFWCKQTKQDKKDGIVRSLCRGSSGSWAAYGGDLANSNEDGRVVLKKIKEKVFSKKKIDY
jgi:hypothetical protein